MKVHQEEETRTEITIRTLCLPHARADTPNLFEMIGLFGIGLRRVASSSKGVKPQIAHTVRWSLLWTFL